ncbi:MAG: hypothetical protein ISS70_13425 [Phycisphaerae bacterium]|nr:hypothetical protein [Phycisphaerae bacterium]
MASKAEELIDKELADRLDRVAFHFQQRDSIRAELEKCIPSDPSGDPLKDSKIRELVTKINNEEIGMLYELVHLRDNAAKYFKVFQHKLSELDVIDKFKPFRIASNYVNTHKHGTRGGNRPSAKHDYTAFIHARNPEEKPSAKDKVCDVRSMINYEGELFDSVELIESLIRIWEMFLRYHTKHDLSHFVEQISNVFARRQGQTLYSARIPEGVLDDAKVNADARKHLRLSQP